MQLFLCKLVLSRMHCLHYAGDDTLCLCVRRNLMLAGMARPLRKKVAQHGANQTGNAVFHMHVLFAPPPHLRNAQVRTLNSRQFDGRIPWTSTFSTFICPKMRTV